MFELARRSSGNEIADDLAKTGVSESYAGLEPYWNISRHYCALLVTDRSSYFVLECASLKTIC